LRDAIVPSIPRIIYRGFLDRDMRRVVETGAFKIMVGGNSVDLIEATLNVIDD
jgi:hypothetical protein